MVHPSKEGCTSWCLQHASNMTFSYHSTGTCCLPTWLQYTKDNTKRSCCMVLSFADCASPHSFPKHSACIQALLIQASYGAATDVAYCRPDHVQVFVMKHTPLFFAERDGPWYPTLRLLHQYPEMMKKLRVDKGALKFVMSGANIMCPGLTSPGATIHDEVRTATCALPSTSFGCFRLIVARLHVGSL